MKKSTDVREALAIQAALSRNALPEPLSTAAKASPPALDAEVLDEGESREAGDADLAAEAGASAGASTEPLVYAQASANPADAASTATATEATPTAANATAAGTGAVSAGAVGMLAVGLAAAAAAAGGGGGSAAAPAAATTLAGRVADGYVRGASIFIDANNNGIADPNEDTGVDTDANGNFTLQNPASGPIIAVGGFNIDTGLPNELILKAPVGSTIVNPLTTVLQEYIRANPAVSTATAQSAVGTSLGLPAGLDLRTYDPLAAADPQDPTALAAQKVAAQIVSVAVLSGGNAAAVFANIVDMVEQAASVDLTDTAILSSVLSGLAGANLAAIEAATDAIEAAVTLDPAGGGSISSLASAALDKTDSAPVLVSGAHASVTENAANGTQVYQARAADAEGNAIVYSLTDDAGGKFAIHATTGVVTVAGAIDYETAQALQFTVAASDGTLQSSRVVTVAVGDMAREAPSITSGALASIAENSAGVVYTTTASNPLGGRLMYSLSGADAAAFGIDASGNVTLLAAADFETPADADGDGVYQITVEVGNGMASATRAVAVTVTDMPGATFALTNDGSGEMTVGVGPNAAGGQYSTDGGATWIDFTGASFAIDAATDLSSTLDALQVVEHRVDGTITDAGKDYSALVVTAGSFDMASADLRVSGNIASLELTAAGESSGASADVSGAALSNSAITATAAGEGSWVDFGLRDATGSIASITVDAAGGGWTSAYADIRFSGEIESFSAQASGSSGSSGDVSADVSLNLDGTLGDATVEASGESSDVYASIYGDVTLDQSVINVTASGRASYADLDLTAAGGSVAAASVAASDDAQARMSMDVATGTFDSLEVTASGEFSDAYADVGFGGSMGDITILASGYRASASVDLGGSSSRGSTDVLTMSASVIDIEASQEGTSARLGLAEASGVIASLTVEASGSSSAWWMATTASAQVQLTGSIGSLAVTASGMPSGGSGDVQASADLMLDGTLGDATVTASGASADARARISGDIALDQAVLDVIASSENASSELDLQGTRGTAASVGVNADAMGATATATIAGTASIGQAGLSATGPGSTAELALDVASVDAVEVTLDQSSTANLNLTLASGGGSITVTGVSGDASSTFNLYVGSELTVDTVDLGAFAGQTNATLDMTDADLVDFPALSAHSLAILGATADLQLIFGQTPAYDYSENETAVGQDTFETAAAAAIGGGSEFYFGVVGGNGYLVYDFDNLGATGVVELVGLTTFDPAQLGVVS